MAATEVTLTHKHVDRQDYDTGGTLSYTYERIDNIVQYYVKFLYRSGQYYPAMNVSHEATINGIKKTGSGSVPQGFTEQTFTLGPWDIEISSPTDTTIPGCSAKITGNGAIPPANSFDAVVPAGGDIPAFVNVNGTVKQCRKAFAKVSGTIESCKVFTKVNGEIKQIG